MSLYDLDRHKAFILMLAICSVFWLAMLFIIFTVFS